MSVKIRYIGKGHTYAKINGKKTKVDEGQIVTVKEVGNLLNNAFIVVGGKNAEMVKTEISRIKETIKKDEAEFKRIKRAINNEAKKRIADLEKPFSDSKDANISRIKELEKELKDALEQKKLLDVEKKEELEKLKSEIEEREKDKEKNEEEIEKLKDQIGDDEVEDNTEEKENDNQADDKNEPDEQPDVNEEKEEKEEEVEDDKEDEEEVEDNKLEAISEMYKDLYKKEVPVNKKNDVNWIEERVKNYKPAN